MYKIGYAKTHEGVIGRQRSAQYKEKVEVVLLHTWDYDQWAEKAAHQMFRGNLAQDESWFSFPDGITEVLEFFQLYTRQSFYGHQRFPNYPNRRNKSRGKLTTKWKKLPPELEKLYRK